MWTRFYDRNTGGYAKLRVAADGSVVGPDGGGAVVSDVLIEAPEVAACAIFRMRYGRDPWNVTCECCGTDYDVVEYGTLPEATARRRHYGHMLILHASDAEAAAAAVQAALAASPAPRRGPRAVAPGGLDGGG